MIIVTLRQGMNPHGFFRLSSVREWLSNGAWLRLVASRSGGGKARNQCLHSGALIPGRCQACWSSHALPKGKKWPTTSVFGVLGSLNTRIFRCSILGNIPTRVEAFPDAIVDAAARTPAVDWLPVPSQQHIADTMVQRGNVFTHGPSPCNPYVIQFSRYYRQLLLQPTKSGNARAKAKTRLTPWVETAGECSGLKSSAVIRHQATHEQRAQLLAQLLQVSGHAHPFGITKGCL
jgi:hypothetical protein